MQRKEKQLLLEYEIACNVLSLEAPRIDVH